jgi:hypothetical protein
VINTSTLRQNWKPILVLMVLSPLLAEVISGGTPVTQFFMPWILFPYVITLYGLQVLVIREVATRSGFGLVGLWCLGAVYGLYNEALRAETLFHPHTSPIDAFSTYGLVGDVRVPFTVWILSWHGLFSVVMPILLVEYRFPAAAGRPWLSRKATWVLATLSVGTAIAYFLFLGEESGTQGGTKLVAHLAFTVVAAVILCVAAGKVSRTPRIVSNGGHDGSTSWRLFTAGAVLYVVLFVVSEVLAELKVPWPLFVVYLTVLATAVLWAVARRRATTRKDAVVLVLGSGTAQAVLGLLVGVLGGNILLAISDAMFIAVFVVTLARMGRKPTAVPDARTT